MRADAQWNRRAGKVRGAFATVIVQHQHTINVNARTIIHTGKKRVGAGTRDVDRAHILHGVVALRLGHARWINVADRGQGIPLQRTHLHRRPEPERRCGETGTDRDRWVRLGEVQRCSRGIHHRELSAVHDCANLGTHILRNAHAGKRLVNRQRRRVRHGDRILSRIAGREEGAARQRLSSGRLGEIHAAAVHKRRQIKDTTAQARATVARTGQIQPGTGLQRDLVRAQRIVCPRCYLCVNRRLVADRDATRECVRIVARGRGVAHHQTTGEGSRGRCHYRHPVRPGERHVDLRLMVRRCCRMSQRNCRCRAGQNDGARRRGYRPGRRQNNAAARAAVHEGQTAHLHPCSP